MPGAEKPILYTIGHGARPIDQFLTLLKSRRIVCLVDIRRWPTSKTTYFKREVLSSTLSSTGIEYLWLGRDLGGYRSGGYESYTKTGGFRKGLKALTKLALKRPTAIVCLEISPKACHRRFISSILASKGWRIVHLIGPGRERQEGVSEILF